MGLFGDEFEIKIKETDVKDLIKKATSTAKGELEPEKLLKSKKLTIQDRLNVININVEKILGKQKSNIVVIRDRALLNEYVENAIVSGRIDIDTETNNSTDACTCQLMGLCLYYPGGKQAYIPINHTDLDSNLLANQLTEKDCKEALQRVLDSKIERIMHNGKFDLEVLKHTCDIWIPPTWDTLIAARLLDENEFSDKRTSLKYIYTSKIDPEQEKYSIDKLFENIPYKYVDPDIFALYAATDALMTDKVYLWERSTFFDLPENKKVLNLLNTIEVPIIEVTAAIEMKGVYIDQELGRRLKLKYNTQLADLDNEINKIIKSADGLRAAWANTTEANNQAMIYAPAKSKMTQEKLELTYPYVDPKTNKRYKLGKAKTALLDDPINLASPVQLAIFLYDILKCPKVNNEKERATGEDELKEIVSRIRALDNKTEANIIAQKFCTAMLTRRGLAKLVTTYIDVIPDLAKHWPDGRIRYRLSSMGTDTGRFASGGRFKFLDKNEKPVELNSINSQNLPSHNSDIRLLFKAPTKYHSIDINDNYFEIDECDEIETSAGWKKIKELVVGDIVVGENTNDIVKNIIKIGPKYLVYV